MFNTVQINKEDSQEIELSHYREAFKELYKATSIKEVRDILETQEDKITLGSSES